MVDVDNDRSLGNAPTDRLLSPPLTSSHLLSPPLTSSRLLSPPLTSSHLLSPPLTSSRLLSTKQTRSERHDAAWCTRYISLDEKVNPIDILM